MNSFVVVDRFEQILHCIARLHGRRIKTLLLLSRLLFGLNSLRLKIVLQRVSRSQKYSKINKMRKMHYLMCSLVKEGITYDSVAMQRRIMQC